MLEASLNQIEQLVSDLMQKNAQLTEQNTALAQTKRQYPTLIGDKLLVLAALNLCSRQIELQDEHRKTLERTQAQIDATVDAIVRTIAEQ